MSNDTDGDKWNDGPEVYFQDHDDDGMATGWEYHLTLTLTMPLIECSILMEMGM